MLPNPPLRALSTQVGCRALTTLIQDTCPGARDSDTALWWNVACHPLIWWPLLSDVMVPQPQEDCSVRLGLPQQLPPSSTRPAPWHCLGEGTEIWLSCKLWPFAYVKAIYSAFERSFSDASTWVQCVVTAHTVFLSDHFLTLWWTSLMFLHFLSSTGCAGGLRWRLRASLSIWRMKQLNSW